LTSRQLKLLQNNDWSNFLTVFNEVHNSTITTSVGIVSVLTRSKNEE